MLISMAFWGLWIQFILSNETCVVQKKKWKHTLLKAYMFKIFSRIKTESTNWKKKDKVGTKKYSTFDFDAWVLLSLSHSDDKEMLSNSNHHYSDKCMLDDLRYYSS